ncbi:hypothetical protein CC78DRAFT_585045 [Lojkania enalia]|uniref:Response regulatory domain-containing protein n=1 Tax=Lojkania enalia TaxID=147567 RepID=A0A9P4K157_9PLEO|nr:hypothetical protein CC78DRAFT_585045 [Didymosphaeria enalia]
MALKRWLSFRARLSMSRFRKVKEKEKITEPLLIIAVTANVRQAQIDAATATGADRVMQKPFKAIDLVNMMRNLILVIQGTAPSTVPSLPMKARPTMTHPPIMTSTND